LAEAESARKVDIGVNVALGTFAVLLKGVRFAATQTVHLADSVPFE